MRKTGNDTNAGTSAGAAWATIQKAHNASAGPAGGDTVWVGAGTYRETVTALMTAPTSELKFVADVDGAKTGDAGEVIWTAYTTNDTTAPAATAPVILNGKPWLTYQGFTWVGGGRTTHALIDGSTTGSHDIKILDFTMLPGAASTQLIEHDSTFGVASNWTIDRGRAFLPDAASYFFVCSLAQGTGADYDANIIVQNVQVFGGNYGVQIQGTGAGANLGGGVRLKNCDFVGQGSYAAYCTGNTSTSIPCSVNNSVIIGGNGGLRAGSLGLLTSDYNLIYSGTAYTNVTAGTHDKTDFSYALMLELGQDRYVGSEYPQPFMAPMKSSPLLAFGSAGTPPTYDLLNRPRPAGGGSTSYAVGALERHDTGVMGGSANADGGSGNCVQLSGPSDHILEIPVDATSTTISIKQKTSAYVGTNYPQITLLANGEIGVASQTVADTSAHTSYTALTLSAFTPTARGVVRLRLENRTGDGSGIVYFDTVSVS